MSLMFAVSGCFTTISNAALQSEVVQGDIIYEDDFSTDAKYNEALGETKWQTFNRPIWETDKLVSGDYTDSKLAKYALFNGLDASSLANYTVEADITAGTANDRVCYVSAYGSITDDKQAGSAYQFTYQGKSGLFNLRRNATTTSGSKADLVTGLKIGDYFSTYTKGDTIRMSITVVTYEDHVHLVCKVTYQGETKEIINYKDYDEKRFTCGMPGVGLQQQNSSLDNVKIAKVKVVTGTVLYEDNFSTDVNYNAALGDTKWQSFKRPIYEDGKLISGDYTAAADAKFALLNGLGAENQMNYTVEADITAGIANDRVCYVAAYGKTNGDNQAGDAYRFSYSGASGTFLLTRNATSASGNKADLVKNVKIANFFSDYVLGDTIRMSITAITYKESVNLICKATYQGETKEIINYIDTSEGRYTCGIPGFGLQQQNSSLDNVKVVKVDESALPTGVLLYGDDFTTNEKYYEALGTVGWQTFKRPTWETDKLVSGDYTASSDAKFALLNGLDAENWTNYTVEADITTSTINSRKCYVAAYGTTTGNKVDGDSYQFYYQGDKTFNLKRTASGTAAKDLLKTKVNNYFENFATGNTIHLSITAVTYDNYVNLVCKATYQGETKEIFNYRDTDEGRYTCGMPGFGLQQQNSSLDNVKVVKNEVVLYDDDFTTDAKYNAALGSTSWHTFVRPLWADGKLSSSPFATNKTGRYALLNGLGAENWTNYTVSADVTPGADNDRVCYVAAYGKTDGDKTFGDSYQFGYTRKSGKFLLRRKALSSTGNNSDLVTNVKIADFFSNYQKGDTIRMSITAVTYEGYVNLICKVTYQGETKEVINYKDTSEGRYTCGMPGFGLQQEDSLLDNVKVELVTLKQLTNEEVEYVCLDDNAYAISKTGVVMVDGKQQTNGSTLSKAGDYVVAITADSLEVTGEVALYYRGDTTGDKAKDENVDVKDLVRLKKGIVETAVFTNAGKKAADLNSDANIDEVDATLLRKMIVLVGM